MNCTFCHGEFGPLPPIAVFVDTALAGEFCSILCLVKWAMGDDFEVKQLRLDDELP